MRTTSDEYTNFAHFIANNLPKKFDHVKKNNLSLKKYFKIIIKKDKERIFK
jgi:hypothetical protein